MKYEVGDTLRIMNQASRSFGLIGKVLEVKDDGKVVLDCRPHRWFHEDELDYEMRPAHPAPAEDDKEYREFVDEYLIQLATYGMQFSELGNQTKSNHCQRLIADIKKGMEQGETVSRAFLDFICPMIPFLAENQLYELHNLLQTHQPGGWPYIANDISKMLEQPGAYPNTWSDADMVDFVHHVQQLPPSYDCTPLADILTAWQQQKKGGGKC